MASIVLVGPPDSGKRTLAAAIANTSPASTHISLVAPTSLPEERRALADCTAVIFVIGASDGIDQRTALLWREVSAYEIPRIIAVTKVDDPKANIDESLALAHRLFDSHTPIFITYPVLGDDETVIGVADLLNGTITDYSQPNPFPVELEPEHQALIADDQSLLRTLVQSVDTSSGQSSLCAATRSGLITPVYFVARSIGVRELTDFFMNCFSDSPAPQSRPWAQTLSPAASGESHVRICVPLDYQGDVLRELHRGGLRILGEDIPGNGTIEWVCTGSAEAVCELPITVAGASECTGTVELLGPPRFDE